MSRPVRRTRALRAGLAVAAVLALAGCDAGSGVDGGTPPVSAPPTLPPHLAALVVVEPDAETPQLPPDDFDAPGLAAGYAQPGPGDGRLTMVIFGSGCQSVPESYVRAAPAHSLQIVSTLVGADGVTACTAQRKPWTSVIEVPEDFSGYSEVLIDNVPVDILPAVVP